jgi:putative FmdB family regulatory protein
LQEKARDPSPGRVLFLLKSITMPHYEYECKKCKHRFEKILKFSDKPMKKCPDCGGAVEQLISAPTVQFKGGGWYVTDYAKKGTSSPSKSADGEGGGVKDSAKDKDSKDTKETKETTKEEKPKAESSSKKNKKD